MTVNLLVKRTAQPSTLADTLIAELVVGPLPATLGVRFGSRADIFYQQARGKNGRHEAPRVLFYRHTGYHPENRECGPAGHAGPLQ